MAKRYTDTLKWDDPWYMRLPPVSKLLWNYICDRCDRSGVIDFCPELASVQIGGTVNEELLLSFGKTRVQQLPSGKWRIMKFLPFQYKTIDVKCPAHKDIILKIMENGIDYPIANLPDNLDGNLWHRVGRTQQEEEEDKEEEVDMEEETEVETETDKDKDIDW